MSRETHGSRHLVAKQILDGVFISLCQLSVLADLVGLDVHISDVLMWVALKTGRGDAVVTDLYDPDAMKWYQHCRSQQSTTTAPFMAGPATSAPPTKNVLDSMGLWAARSAHVRGLTLASLAF